MATQRQVTIPMVDVLEEAPEWSPWDDVDLTGYTTATVRTLDDLSDVARMLVIKRLRGVRRREKDVLEAIASKGWASLISQRWLQWATDRSESSVSHALRALVDDGALRISRPRIAPDGSRLYLMVISGSCILQGYAPDEPAQGGLLDVTSREPAPDEPAQGGLLDVTSSEPAPEGPNQGGLLDVTSSEPAPEGPNQGVHRVRARGSARARGRGSFVDDHDRHDSRFYTSINERPTRARPRAREAPGWWELFASETSLIGISSVPSWSEIQSIADVGDSDLVILQEACAQLLATYGQPGAPPVRRVRGAVRSIYVRLIGEALRLPGGVDEYREHCWASDRYLRSLTADEAQQLAIEDVPRRVPPPPSGDLPAHDPDAPAWYVRLLEYFPSLPDYAYLQGKGLEMGADRSALTRAAELTIAGCRHPEGALEYWLRCCATAVSQARSAAEQGPRKSGRRRPR